MAESSGRRSLLTTWVALTLAAIYIFACWFLVDRFALENPLPDAQWQRALVIFSGISSIGFAAIGVLLGTAVQQVNVSAAREQAAASKGDADKKGAVIKDAISALKPADLGGGDRGGAQPDHTKQALDILLKGLA